jgi:hypothetical protein
MIKGFRDEETEKVFNGRFSKKLPHDIQRIAERNLLLLFGVAVLLSNQLDPNMPAVQSAAAREDPGLAQGPAAGPEADLQQRWQSHH